MTSGRTVEQFVSDEAAFDAALFNLQVIGEAIKRLPADVLALLPAADRSGPARLRDLIAHHYFALDPEIIWDVATRLVGPGIASPSARIRAVQGDGIADLRSSGRLARSGSPSRRRQGHRWACPARGPGRAWTGA